MSSYELHRPLDPSTPTTDEEAIAAIEGLCTRLDQLYAEAAANDREHADLSFHIRTTEAELERRRFGLLRRAGLDDRPDS